jgi:hypothetical protein
VHLRRFQTSGKQHDAAVVLVDDLNPALHSER